MVSFLSKLKGEGITKDEPKTSASVSDTLKGVVQLDLDIFQTQKEIVMYAPLSGALIEDIDISVSGDDDIIIIKGTKKRPEKIAFEGKEVEGQYYAEECVWGEFYRQIILPEQITMEHSQAKLTNGVLILILPLAKIEDKKKSKIKVVSLEDEQ